MKKIVLIDGHNLLFRMFYGIPHPIKNSKGKDIRGLIGFIGSLKKIVKELKPYSIYVVFDSETSTNNNLKIDTNYKANRINYCNINESENPFSQLPLIKKALTYLNISYSEIENNEADDLIASIVSKFNYKFIIVSTDKDYIQLISKNVSLYTPHGKDSILYNSKKVIEKYGISPDKYVLFKSLVGDNSDNIKGIKGIGNKRAVKILNHNSIKDCILNTILLNKKLIDKNKKLITLNNELDTNNIIFNKLTRKLYTYKTNEIIEKIKEK